jgi:hypothetical protein
MILRTKASLPYPMVHPTPLLLIAIRLVRNLDLLQLAERILPFRTRFDLLI